MKLAKEKNVEIKKKRMKEKIFRNYTLVARKSKQINNPKKTKLGKKAEGKNFLIKEFGVSEDVW